MGNKRGNSIHLEGNLPLPGFYSLELEPLMREAICQMQKAKKGVESKVKTRDGTWQTLNEEDTEAQVWLNLLISVSSTHHYLSVLSSLSPKLDVLCSSALRRTGELLSFVTSEMGMSLIMNLFVPPMTLHYTSEGSLKVFSDSLEHTGDIVVGIEAELLPTPPAD